MACMALRYRIQPYHDGDDIRSRSMGSGEIMMKLAWIVNDLGELGVEIDGRCYFLYKGNSLEYTDPVHEDGNPILYREVGKREFGETVWPMQWINNGKCEDRYTQELTYYPGLSFGSPDDPRYKWKPLPK